FAWYIAGWHTPFADGPHRLSLYAIEDVEKAGLPCLCHDVDRLAISPNRRQLRRGSVVVVPQIVMDHLEMPQPFPGSCVEGKQRRAKEIRAVAIGTVEIVGGRTEREVRDRPLLVDGELAPRVHAADVLPRILRPRLVSEFTGMWNRVELPHKLTGDDVECPQIAGGRHVVLTRCRTKNDQVFEHLPRV